MVEKLLFAVGKLRSFSPIWREKAVAEALDGLPKEKMHCSNLGAQALSEAIEDYEEKKIGKQKSATKTTKKEKSKKHITCSQCNTQNLVAAKFCMACGERVK